MNLLADAVSQGTPPSTQPVPTWVDLLGFRNGNFLPLMIILIVLMLWTSSRSKKREQQARDDMLNNMKKGDRIQTIGGILGTIVEARETEILVKVDESSNTKIRFTRGAIAKVLEEEKSESK